MRRLAEIERELDDTSPVGPYRTSRQKLNRERGKLWKRKEGMDPMWFATRREGCTRPNSNEKDIYLIKVQVVSILEGLNARG